MPTITIPQALIKEKELILIPRREYDKLLKKQTTKRETKAVKRSASFHVPQKHHKFYEKFYKQIEFLLLNIRHPSLRAKKYDELNGIWQARVNTNVRFYFKILKDTYLLLNIKNHPK